MYLHGRSIAQGVVTVAPAGAPARPFPDDEIRLHRGNGNGTTRSGGCFDIRDYDGFLKFLGGRDTRFNRTLVEA